MITKGFPGACTLMYLRNNSLVSSMTEEEKKNQTPKKRVAIHLSNDSISKLEKQYPQFSGTKIVFLESQELAGSGVFEPLFGLESILEIKGLMSCSTVEGVSVFAFLQFRFLDMCTI